jgi:hypothetical protein
MFSFEFRIRTFLLSKVLVQCQKFRPIETFYTGLEVPTGLTIAKIFHEFSDTPSHHPLGITKIILDAQLKLVPLRYDPEMPKAVDQVVQYLVYGIGWLSQGILQGNISYLEWGCLSHDRHSLI